MDVSQPKVSKPLVCLWGSGPVSCGFGTMAVRSDGLIALVACWDLTARVPFEEGGYNSWMVDETLYRPNGFVDCRACGFI